MNETSSPADDAAAGRVAPYIIRRTAAAAPLAGEWDHPAWRVANTLAVDRFHARSSEHHPRARVRQLFDAAGIYTLFQVEDRYVRSVQTDLNDPVCTDSCAEFFVQPKPDRGYLNFEINCGGTLHCSFVEDATRTPQGFRKWTPVSPELAARIRIWHSLPQVVEPEISAPTTWRVAFFVPFSFFEHYVGALGTLPGQEWRANYYKCGDRTSHPHWATWAPIEVLNFHQPDCFGPIRLEACHNG